MAQKNNKKVSRAEFELEIYKLIASEAARFSTPGTQLFLLCKVLDSWRSQSNLDWVHQFMEDMKSIEVNYERDVIDMSPLSDIDKVLLHRKISRAGNMKSELKHITSSYEESKQEIDQLYPALAKAIREGKRVMTRYLNAEVL